MMESPPSALSAASSLTRPRRILVGISGASGAGYARRVLQLLLKQDIEVHLVVSPLGQRLLHDELGPDAADPRAMLEQLPDPPPLDRLIVHHYRDVGASIASGSFRHDGMAIIPCSGNTLAAVANGSANNLMHRAAHVTLKERRPLVLLHREMPVSLIDIRNMEQVTLAGGIICPASPGFYLQPRSLEDLIDFVAGKVLDLLDVEHRLDVRWKDPSMVEG